MIFFIATLAISTCYGIFPKKSSCTVGISNKLGSSSGFAGEASKSLTDTEVHHVNTEGEPHSAKNTVNRSTILCGGTFEFVVIRESPNTKRVSIRYY